MPHRLQVSSAHGNLARVFGRELAGRTRHNWTGGSGARQLPCGVMRTSDFVPRSRRTARPRATRATATVVGGGYVSNQTANGFSYRHGDGPRTRRGAGQRPGRTTQGQLQEHDRATNTSFTATTDAAGNAVLTLHGGDFTLEKVVAHTGDATLRLSQGKDVVTIAISQSGFQVARGQKTLRVDPRSDWQDKADSVRSILVGSQAVRSFKRLVSALEQRDESEDDGPLALSAMVDGAIVQLLDGDPDAARRLAKRITRKQRAALRVVKAGRMPGRHGRLHRPLSGRADDGIRPVRELCDRIDRSIRGGAGISSISCAHGSGRFDLSSTSGNSSGASCFHGDIHAEATAWRSH